MLSRTVSYSSNLTVAPAMFWGLLLASLAVRLYAVIISPLEPVLMKHSTGCGGGLHSWAIIQNHLL